ncbi:hypothetical protein NQ315_011199 [Exocentrus adspersus]|uniref:Uncharacterized protein n=1 Tax=Exocentrus adspersus TaxID=1586481 RepID=A0AAV8V6H1_9CUCU|nr:hypothetical protein NQ315_011199 [Exocentrus adspersus]
MSRDAQQIAMTGKSVKRVEPMKFPMLDRKRRTIDTRENLLERINLHCDEIRANVDALWRTQQSLIRRARKCITLEGAHVEPTYSANQ